MTRKTTLSAMAMVMATDMTLVMGMRGETELGRARDGNVAADMGQTINMDPIMMVKEKGKAVAGMMGADKAPLKKHTTPAEGSEHTLCWTKRATFYAAQSPKLFAIRYKAALESGHCAVVW